MKLLPLNDRSVVPAIIAGLLLALPACQNVPSHRDIMYYNRQYELRAAQEIAELRARRDAGEISESTYTTVASEIVEEVPEKATEALFRNHLVKTRTAQPPPVR